SERLLPDPDRALDREGNTAEALLVYELARASRRRGFTGGFGAEPVERLLGGELLGLLLRLPLPHPGLLAVDHRRGREHAVVGRTVDLEQDVHDRAAAPGERLLQLRLVVDLVRERVLDAAF